MKQVQVTLVNTFKDGGTQQYKDADGKDYFLDGRLSRKAGEELGDVYDRYPGDKMAVRLDVMLIPSGLENLLNPGGSTHEGAE